jgi:hypothetical protein
VSTPAAAAAAVDIYRKPVYDIDGVEVSATGAMRVSLLPIALGLDGQLVGLESISL